MPFFSGFAGKFGEELARSRSEEADRAERQNALESSVLQHLSTSPDPEIASHAITGLLDLASPQRKAKGLAGWLGKVQAHPALPTIRQLIGQGRQVEDQPPHVPTLQAKAGLDGMPGQAVDSPAGAAGAPGATSAPPVHPASRTLQGPPEPGAAQGGQAGPAATPSQQSATTPPPLAPFAPGDAYRPATSKTVPRRVLRQPGELEAEQAGEKETAVLNARGEAYDRFSGTPGKQSLVPGVNNPAAPRAAGEIQDEQGNWFKQDVTIGPDGTRTLTRTPISKAAARPTGPEAQALELAQQILATEGGTPEAALTKARQMGMAATQAKVLATADTHTIRLGQMQAMIPATIAAWQRVNGTVPMTRAQAASEAFRALSSARLTLGGGPDITTEDITRMADGLLGAINGRPGPAVSPTRAALAQPLAVDPQPGVSTPAAAPAGSAAAPPPSTLTGALPGDLTQVNPRPRQLSAGQQDERTTAQQILTLSGEVLQEGEALQWKGVGGMGAGSVGQFLGNTFGDMAGPDAQKQIAAQTSLRNKINRIFGIIGQLQGGRTFTGTELQIIKGYAPTINQSVPALKANLAALTSYVEERLARNVENLERPGKQGGGAPPATPTAPPPATQPKAGGAAGGPVAVPPAVEAILKSATPGRHTLTDGSVWIKDASGAIRPGG